MKCARCNNERQTVPIYRPGGHTWFTPGQSDFTSPTENVCGDCLTDNEIMRKVSPVAEFAIGALIQSAAEHPLPGQDSTLVALETTRTYFMVRNSSPCGSNRRAALKAIGLQSD